MNFIKLFAKNYLKLNVNSRPECPPLQFDLANHKTGEYLFLPTGKWLKYNLMDKTHVGDSVMVKYLKKQIQGIVIMITPKGLGCSTDYGYKFIKWQDIISKKFVI